MAIGDVLAYGDDKAHDEHLYDVVGDRIRAQRTLMGLSQDDLGKAIGVSFQQVQKYENGRNQISLSRLVRIAEALHTPVAQLISGFDVISPASVSGFAESGQAEFGAAAGKDEVNNAQARQRETLELVRAYYSVADDKKRRKILDFIKSMGDE